MVLLSSFYHHREEMSLSFWFPFGICSFIVYHIKSTENRKTENLYEKKRNKMEGLSVYINRETGRTRNRFFWRKAGELQQAQIRRYQTVPMPAGEGGSDYGGTEALRNDLVQYKIRLAGLFKQKSRLACFFMRSIATIICYQSFPNRT